MRLKGNLCWSNHPLTKRQLPSLHYAAIIPLILLNSKGGPKFKTAHYRKTRSDAKGDFPMKDKPLANVRVAILATNDFEQSEMTEPRQALKEAGAQTTLIAPKSGKLQAMKHDIKADYFDVDLVLERANPADFDAVVLPGGALNADALRVDKKAQEFIRRIDEAGKPIAVICHGAWLLVSAGLTKGRTLTSYHTIQDDIRNSGGQWVDHEVVCDRNWISSRQPSDLPAFNREMIALFSGEKAGAH
jgi:protease I